MIGPRVLFVGHGADRTGPPIGLLHLLRWLRDHTDVQPEILLLTGGPLLPDYREIGPVTVLDEWNPPRAFGALESAVDWPLTRRWQDRAQRAGMRWRLRHLNRPDLVYVNTAWTLRALRYLPEGVPVVAAVHELEVGLDYHLPDWVHDLLTERPTRVVAVSEAVADNLVEHHGLDRRRVAVHYEMIEARRVDGDNRRRRRRELGAADETVIVGASGLTHWRKAPDLFVRLARRVVVDHPDRDVRFVWVGGDHGSTEATAFREDAERAALGDRFQLVPHVADPLEWFAAMDVFVLPAREDAFPLVCLEAAAQQVPVVCFDNGGMPEFVCGGDQACGAVVPYPDLAAMAQVVGDLVEHDGRRQALGRAAATRVGIEYDTPAVAPGLWATVEACLP